MKKAIDIINKISDLVGGVAAWCTSLLVVLVCYDVFMRYFFANSKTWILELEWHLFAVIFLLGAAMTLKDDKHVRVDVFYSNWSARKKAWVNLIGAVLLLIPWCLIVIWKAGVYTSLSFAIREGSPQPGGLPARYLIKGGVALGFTILLLQGIALLLRSIYVLRSKDISE